MQPERMPRIPRPYMALDRREIVRTDDLAT